MWQSLTESANRDAFEIGGRGELQLGVLIETMRREGFEMTVSRPRVLYKKADEGTRLEPIEEVTIDVDEDYASAVVDSLNRRKGEMVDMRSAGAGKTRLLFLAIARTNRLSKPIFDPNSGTGVLNRIFHSYAPHKGPIESRRNGALISTDAGMAVAYALFNLQDRGQMFVGPQTAVYRGMIVGEHSRDNDLEINVLKVNS